ncbi:MAG TPA: hypothetical protein ENK14_11710 [Caldithrix sp.]|nr:hypothetical protein [Caldithrix sp.]
MACNHCLDPVCMKYCPALAYRKDAQTGAVTINTNACGAKTGFVLRKNNRRTGGRLFDYSLVSFYRWFSHSFPSENFSS